MSKEQIIQSDLKPDHDNYSSLKKESRVLIEKRLKFEELGSSFLSGTA